jgi:hypothetical protein
MSSPTHRRQDVHNGNSGAELATAIRRRGIRHFCPHLDSARAQAQDAIFGAAKRQGFH